MRGAFRVLVIIAAIVLPPAAYICGYLWLGNAYSSYRTSPASRTIYLEPHRDAQLFRIVRRYPHEWERLIFTPGGKLESSLRGIEVYVELPPDDERRRIWRG